MIFLSRVHKRHLSSSRKSLILSAPLSTLSLFLISFLLVGLTVGAPVVEHEVGAGLRVEAQATLGSSDCQAPCRGGWSGYQFPTSRWGPVLLMQTSDDLTDEPAAAGETIGSGGVQSIIAPNGTVNSGIPDGLATPASTETIVSGSNVAPDEQPFQPTPTPTFEIPTPVPSSQALPPPAITEAPPPSRTAAPPPATTKASPPPATTEAPPPKPTEAPPPKSPEAAPPKSPEAAPPASTEAPPSNSGNGGGGDGSGDNDGPPSFSGGGPPPGAFGGGDFPGGFGGGGPGSLHGGFGDGVPDGFGGKFDGDLLGDVFGGGQPLH